MGQMRYLTEKDIADFERFYRTNLINSATGYKPANLIGTYSANGNTNLALFSSVVHLGANPALIGFIQRPLGAYSHTYKNIKESGFYTINHVHKDIVENAHFTSAKFDEQTSEFEVCGFTEEKLKDFNAPFVLESRIKIGLKFVQEIAIDINKTILMIGKIEHLLIDRKAIQPDGNLDLNYVESICVSGLGTYYQTKKIKSLPYARVTDLDEF